MKKPAEEPCIGPFTIDIKVHVENPETSQIGSATVAIGAGRVPKLEDLHLAVGQTLDQLPTGFRLLQGQDFFNKVLVRERFGSVGKFYAPGFDYDVEALTLAGKAALARKRARSKEKRNGNRGEEE